MDKRKNLTIAGILGGALAVVIAGALALQFWVLPNYDIADLLPDDAQAEMVNGAAPDFEFLSEQGHRQFLSDFEGTPVVLNFWASWCPPCRMEKPHFQQAFEQYGNDVKFIVLNVDEPIEVARAYMDEEGFTFPIYFDEASEGALAYGVTGVPETFFIDSDGIISSRFMGAINFDTIEHALQEILDEE
ncbi:MAG: TlpA family protein disulfide reductase [Coriobacteriia bacterium]|nr:TlpA family protein disulfide reductase [Coriobacteriia bacterium]MCL2871123.1 TlpA family protein disulfide reductase [Coriobacteriia bacterium]